jgi:hypothetical protein
MNGRSETPHATRTDGAQSHFEPGESSVLGLLKRLK